MARPVTTLALFFIAFNLLAGVMTAQGVFDTLGVNEQVGEDQEVTNRLDDAQNVSTGAPTGSTLFGMYNVLSTQIGNLFGVIFPGLRMLERVGVPNWITQGLLGPIFSFAIGVGTLSFLRGWDL
jgi:hypothetical protein